MTHTRLALAIILSGAAVAAQAQVGTHGDVGGMPYGPTQATTPDQPSAPAWATKNPWSTSYSPLAFFHSTKSRAQVRAELVEGRQAMLAHEGLAPPPVPSVSMVPGTPPAY